MNVDRSLSTEGREKEKKVIKRKTEWKATSC